MERSLKRFAIIVLLCALVAPVERARAEISSSEESLLAAFIFNITKFTHWKTMADGGQEPLRISVINNQDVLSALETAINGKTVNSRKIEVRMAANEKAGTEVIVAIAKDDTGPNLQKFKGCKCLVITQKAGLSQQGAIINFIKKDDRLRFEVNLAAARAEGIEFDSQLLRIGDVTVP